MKNDDRYNYKFNHDHICDSDNHSHCIHENDHRYHYEIDHDHICNSKKTSCDLLAILTASNKNDDAYSHE